MLFRIICLKLATEGEMGRIWGSVEEGSEKTFREAEFEFGDKG